MKHQMIEPKNQFMTLPYKSFNARTLLEKSSVILRKKNGIEVKDRVTPAGKERSWRLPLDERILHFFRKNPAAVTVEEMHD